MFRRKLFMTERRLRAASAAFCPIGEAMFTMVKMLTNIFFQ
jgi:hypothetical protein